MGATQPGKGSRCSWQWWRCFACRYTWLRNQCDTAPVTWLFVAVDDVWCMEWSGFWSRGFGSSGAADLHRLDLRPRLWPGQFRFDNLYLRIRNLLFHMPPTAMG